MIKNLVFDFGQVMIRYEPAYMVGRYVSDPDDARLLETVVFDRLYWDRLDDDGITDEALLAAAKQRLPQRLWETAETVYWNWIYNLPPITGMAELVEEMKARYGVRVFLLSNISRYFSDHAAEFEVFRLFEKCIFSAACGHVKPHADMFAYLCDTCAIKAEETLFVDDNRANIAGAEAFGIKGYLFDGDAAKLRTYLIDLLGKGEHA